MPAPAACSPPGVCLLVVSLHAGISGDLSQAARRRMTGRDYINGARYLQWPMTDAM
jgi:hypothetical protein